MRTTATRHLERRAFDALVELTTQAPSRTHATEPTSHNAEDHAPKSPLVTTPCDVPLAVANVKPTTHARFEQDAVALVDLLLEAPNVGLLTTTIQKNLGLTRKAFKPFLEQVLNELRFAAKSKTGRPRFVRLFDFAAAEAWLASRRNPMALERTNPDVAPPPVENNSDVPVSPKATDATGPGTLLRLLVTPGTDLGLLAARVAPQMCIDPEVARAELHELLATAPLVAPAQRIATHDANGALRGWNGAPFPPKAERVVLPDGRVLEDAVICPNFLQEELGTDPDELWRNLLAYPTWPSNQPIPFRDLGHNAHWIPGNHPALHMRGHALKRAKIWLQSAYPNGLRKYTYPGRQWPISFATHAIDSVPAVQRLVEGLNEGLMRSGHAPHNHVIATRYADQGENIGYHSDNEDDFAENSYFVVLKFGAPRQFAFRLPPSDENPNPRPFLSRTLAAGTAVFVRCNAHDAANRLIQHGVPQMKTPVGMSGSIVSRCIQTVIPWDKVRREVASAARRKGGQK